MKYSNQKNYRDYLQIEIQKTINNLDRPTINKKNFLVEGFSNLKKKIINIFSKTNLN
jgi:hypothetical protein